MAAASCSSPLIISGVFASPRSQTTPSAAFTSILPFGTSWSRKMTVSTFRARPTSSRSFGFCDACGLVRLRAAGFARGARGLAACGGSGGGGVCWPLSTKSSPSWTTVRRGISEYLTAVRIGSIPIRYPLTRLRNAIAQEQVAAGLVRGQELQVDRREQRVALDDREALARPGDRGRDRQEQLIYEALAEQRGVQMRAALAQQRADSLGAQLAQAGNEVADQAERVRGLTQQRRVLPEVAGAGRNDRERVRAQALALAFCLQLVGLRDAPI